MGAAQAPVTITVKACAYLNDKVTAAKSECKETTIEIFYASSLTWTPTSLSLETEQLSQQVNFSVPTISWTPADANTLLSFTISTLPTYITLL